ncbi:MAG: hypothetical protein LBQ46_11930 [Treponema sp.]|nr:hypothetical protein [Treponema sp.]
MVKKEDLKKKLREIDFDFVSDIGQYSPAEMVNITKEFDIFSAANIIPAKKAILGLDIYKYSEFAEQKQNIIPYIFDLILEKSIKYVMENEPSLFKNYEKQFISTGDGGFLIFEKPLHALVFNFYFYTVLHQFNTGHIYPKLSQYMGEIIIRSAMTYDNIFQYEHNYYGKAIILNARILSKDRLNRCLLDSNVYNYFTRHFNGIESLSIISMDTIKKALNSNEDFISYFFYKEDVTIKQLGYGNDPIKNIHIQKIDDMFAKSTPLIIYNLEIQIMATIFDKKIPNEKTSFILTIGNMTAIN